MLSAGRRLDYSKSDSADWSSQDAFRINYMTLNESAPRLRTEPSGPRALIPSM